MSNKKIPIILSALAMSLVSFGFIAGVAHSRQIMAEAAQAAADHPTNNSFTKCLTEAWEQTGELDPEWKGKRGWVLKETGTE